MTSSKACLLSFTPPELLFRDVVLNQVYTQQVVIGNNLSIAVTLSIRPGSSERYSVSPPSITIPAGASVPVVVTLKVTKFADRKKAETVGQKDIFHVKSSYFEQKFYSIFFLASPASPAYVASQYGGLLSPPNGRTSGGGAPSWRGADFNCHRREGLQVPHADAPVDGWAATPEPRRAASWAQRMPGEQGGLGRGQDSPSIPASLQAGAEEGDGGAPLVCGRATSPLPGPTSRGLRPGELASPTSSASLSPRPRPPTTSHRLPQSRTFPEELSKNAPQPAEDAAGEDTGRAAAGVLEEKEEIIGALKAQLRVRSGRAGLGGPPPEACHPPGAALVEQVAEVEGANKALRARLREVTLELAAERAERTTLLQLQETLEATTPDASMLADAALIRERARAASREEKVLAVLAAKDAAISSLEGDMEAAGAALQCIRSAVDEVCAQLERSEARVVELLEARQAAREQAAAARQDAQRALQEARTARDDAERRAQAAESSQAALQASLEEKGAQIEELRRANEELTAQLREAKESERHALRTAAKMKEVEAVEAACRDEPASWKQALAAAEEALTAKDDMVHQLEETLTQQMERIQALTAQLRPPPGPLPAPQEAVLQARIAHLEQQLAARPASAAPLWEGADAAPEPRRARPSLPPSSPSTAEDPAGSSQRGGPGGPQAGGRSYSTLIGKGPARRSPHRPTTRVPSEGESGRAASQEAPSAELVARAEAAERAARKLEAQVEQLQARLQAEPQERGAGAGKAEAEEALLRVEVERLRIHLTDLERELAVATGGVAQRERRWLDHKEAAARRALAAAASHAAEVGTATRRATEAERKAAVAAIEAGQLREELQAARAEAERARAAAESGKVGADKRVAAKEKEMGRLKEEALSLRRAAEQAASVADEKSLQVTVLMETVETLHAGSDAEREQRLVSLTAQLAGAKGVQAALERRAAHLQEEARQAAQGSAVLRTEVERLGAGVQQREQRLAHSAAALAVVQREVGGLRAELRRRDAETSSLAREVDRLMQGLQAKTEEAASMTAALEQQRKRLHAQLQRERAEAAAELKAAREEHAAAASPQDTEPGGPAAVATSLQRLLDDLPLAEGQQDGQGGDWRPVVIERLSRLVVESERQLSRAQAEGRMSHREATRLRGQVAALEGALERKSIEWEVVEGQLAAQRAHKEQRQEDTRSVTHMDWARSLLGVTLSCSQSLKGGKM